MHPGGHIGQPEWNLVSVPPPPPIHIRWTVLSTRVESPNLVVQNIVGEQALSAVHQEEHQSGQILSGGGWRPSGSSRITGGQFCQGRRFSQIT